MPESVFSSGWNYQGRCGGWVFQEAQTVEMVPAGRAARHRLPGYTEIRSADHCHSWFFSNPPHALIVRPVKSPVTLST